MNTEVHSDITPRSSAIIPRSMCERSEAEQKGNVQPDVEPVGQANVVTVQVSKMSKSSKTLLYKKGQNSILDEKFSVYKKTSVWSGLAVNEALTQEEVEIMIILWKREQRTPWKLTVHDVSTLADFTTRIISYRKRMVKEKSRQRKERERKKVRDAAKNGDKEAMRKIEGKKKRDRG